VRQGVLLLAVSLLAVSCSDSGGESSSTTKTEKSSTTTAQTAVANTDPPTTTSSTTTTAPPPTTGAAIPEVAQFGMGQKAGYEDGSSVQVFSYEQPVVTTSIIKPPAGKEMASADVEVCTGTRAQTSITSRGVTAYKAGGGTYPTDLRGKTPTLMTGLLSPGQCQRGFVSFLVPMGERAAVLVWEETGWEMAKWPVA
jgi:hypothetical protein